jgi:CRP/FNR family cyclic AMP-dependent transcriptional regulator
VFTKHDRKMDLLTEVSLFRGCARRELRKLAKITTEVTAFAGRALCEEGKVGGQFVVVVDGDAAVTIAGDDVGWVGAGGFFGEVALLDGGPHVATVTAVTDMDLLVLSRTEFVELLAEVPVVTRRLLEVVARRLRASDDELHPNRWNARRTGNLRYGGTFSLIGGDPFAETLDVADGLFVELGDG